MLKSYVALLRSINVSGHNIIKMADLKELLSGPELYQVQTYLQSGNIVFQSKSDNSQDLAAYISDSINNHYGYDIQVKVLDKTSFEASYNNNPFLTRNDLDLKALYYIHLLGTPRKEDFYAIKTDPRFSEEMHLNGDIIYVYYKNGFGRSKLSGAVFEKKLNLPITARNNNTMKNLCAKLAQVSNESE